MTTPMDEKRLAEIRARVEAATPGPWKGDTGQHPPYPQVVRAPVPVNAMTDVVATVTRFQGDQAFIAHARTDVPDLLAEVERLRRHLIGAGHVPEVCDVLLGTGESCWCIDSDED